MLKKEMKIYFSGKEIWIYHPGLLPSVTTYLLSIASFQNLTCLCSGLDGQRGQEKPAWLSLSCWGCRWDAAAPRLFIGIILHEQRGLNFLFSILFHPQEKKFVQMVKDAGSPGIEKQIIGQKNLKSLEARYEQTLQQLADVIKVTAQTLWLHSNLIYTCLRFKRCTGMFLCSVALSWKTDRCFVLMKTVDRTWEVNIQRV